MRLSRAVLVLGGMLGMLACRESVIGTYPDLSAEQDAGPPKRPLLVDVCRLDDGDLVAPLIDVRRGAACANGDGGTSTALLFSDKRGAVFPPEYPQLHALCGRMNPAPKTQDHLVDAALAADLRALLSSLLARPALQRALADVPEPERLAALEAAWLPGNAFEHVLCGELGLGGQVGGLHQWSEFYYAEREGRADYQCALEPVGDEDVVTIRFSWQPPGTPSFVEKPKGGFHVRMSPACTLAIGYLALRDQIRPSMVGGVALRAEVYGRELYFALGLTDGAILTLYPVAF